MQTEAVARQPTEHSCLIQMERKNRRGEREQRRGEEKREQRTEERTQRGEDRKRERKWEREKEKAFLSLSSAMVGTVKNRLDKFLSEMAQAYLMLHYGGRNGIKHFLMSLFIAESSASYTIGKALSMCSLGTEMPLCPGVPKTGAGISHLCFY